MLWFRLAAVTEYSIPMRLSTGRLVLRPWRDDDIDAFATLHADPEVMADVGGVLSRDQAAAKLGRYSDAYARLGYCRWAVEGRDGGFLGYVGPMPMHPDNPLAPGVDLGWRLARSAWGQGYATEAARAAIEDGFTRLDLSELVAMTAPTNLRSQAVMTRLGLTRQPERDFDLDSDGQQWRAMIWVARR